MWVIASVVLLLITAVITQHIVIRKLEKQLGTVIKTSMRMPTVIKKGEEEMIKKATFRPQEVEHIEFENYESFKEVSDFLAPLIAGLSLNFDRQGEETFESKWRTFEAGVIIYRYLDPDTNTYEYRAMNKNEFFLIYE